MREGYGTCFFVRSVCLSVCLSLLLQRSAIASTRQLRYEQAKHDHGLQCDSWIMLKCFRSRVMYGWLTLHDLTAILDFSDNKRAHS